MVSPDSTTEESKSSFSDESQKTIYSRSPAPHQATPALSLTESKSDDELDTSTPSPKTYHQQKKGKKKKKQPSSAKRSRNEQPEEEEKNDEVCKPPTKKKLLNAVKKEEEKNDEICEPPTKKKTLHAVKKESPAKERKNKKALKEIVAETVGTPLSSQKSAKKFARVWSPKDELYFFNGLLAFFKTRNGLPKNLGYVYDHIRNTLDNQYSNGQFADKVSRWKAKFRASEDKEMTNTLCFKNTHEAAIFNVCKQLWGGHDEGDHGDNYLYEEIDEHRSSEGDAKNVDKASMNGKEKEKKKKHVVPKDENVEEDMPKAEDNEVQEAKEEDGEDGPQSKKPVAINAVANDLANPKTESGQLSQELYRKPRKEMDAMMNEIRKATAIMLKESLLKTTAMIQDFLNTRTDHLQLPNRGRISVFHSANGATTLSSEKIEALEQRWREQHSRELEACSRRFGLLQKECQISLEELQAAVRSGRY